MNRFPLSRLLIEAVKSGTIAALAMMPFGLAFRALGMRVGHYGPKFAALFVDDPGRGFLFMQHIVLGWVSALPLLVLFASMERRASPVLLGSLYGAAYYVLVNALALPLYFGDRMPWQLGIGYVIPSLVVHIVFGACVGLVSQRLLPAKEAGDAAAAT
nr:hypothetical protein [uncultured Caldimonas sp.]